MTETTDEKPDTTEDKTQIVYRQPVMKGDGTTEVIEHGPMDRDDWSAYEKEHGL